MAYPKREQNRINAGLCRACGQPRDGTAKTCCNNCVKKMVVFAKKRSLRLRKAGLCADCGQETKGSRVHCENCLTKQRIRRDTWKKNIPYGFCTTCRKKECLFVLRDAKLHMRRCQECYLRHSSACQFGAAKYWTVLLEKLEEQQWQCVYSGDKIILGLNDSMDHIIPKSKRPDLIQDQSNIQWVTRVVNRLKDNLTHDEFLSLVGRIYKRCLTKN